MTTSSSQFTLPALMLGGLLSLGAIGGSLILSHGAQKVAAAKETISVKGVAEQAIRADHAQWTSSVAVRASSQAEGIPLLRAEMQKVTQALTTGGLIKPQDIQLTNWNATPVYQKLDNGNDGPLIGYDLTQQFGVVVNNVDTPTQLSQRMEQLIVQGLSIGDTQTQYLVGNLDQIKLKLIGEATRDAKTRAEEFAKSGGVKVGNLVSASQGVFQIRAPLSTDDDEYGGSYDTSTIDKIARVVVTTDYAIAR